MTGYSEEQDQRIEELKARRQAEADSDLQKIVETEEGRRFLWRMIGDCDCFSPITITNASMYLIQGQKNVGLRLMADIERVSTNAFMTMMIEGKRRQLQDEEFIAGASQEDGGDS